jgi:hypothetical protein
MRTLLVLVVAAGCAHNVNQDAASGPDAKIAGAKKLKIAESKLRETGIVTYPGGDRVDWKAIELPTGKHGRLEVTLTYTTPRPGLHVSFDLFDRYQAPVDDKVYKTDRRTRTASLVDVADKVFVRVYAPRRGDAGKYTLEAKFTEAPPPIDMSKLSVPPPPPLAELEKLCDTFDPNIKACADVCPATGAPPHWKACDRQPCNGRDDPEIKSCADTMPCNGRTDPRIKSCAAVMACPAVSDSRIADCNKPVPTPDPVFVTIIKLDIVAGQAVIQIPVGSNQKVDRTWTGTLLQGSTSTPLPNGEITIIRVEQKLTLAKVKLTFDVVQKNLNVRLQPPTPTHR